MSSAYWIWHTTDSLSRLCFITNVQNIVESVLLLSLISVTPLLTILVVYKINYFAENIILLIQGY
jgi:hypothetical protein